MKNITNKFKLQLVAAIAASILFVSTANAQNDNEIKDLKVFSQTELATKYKTFTADAGFKKLLDDANKKGFGKIENTKEDSYSWGFSGKHMVDKQLTDVVICMYDFANEKGQMCSMVWCKIGTKTYKAYAIFPTDKEEFDALGSGTEWFTDGKNNIQLAHSFFSCLANKLETKCHSVCTSSDKNCINLAKVKKTISINIFGIKYSSTTTKFSISKYAACAGGSCAACIALYVFSCGLSVIG